MDRDKPHIFEPMPEVPIPYARTGPLAVRPDQWGHGKRLCQVCRKPETDMVHQAAERATHEPEHWG